jgi:hypothetical protein
MSVFDKSSRRSSIRGETLDFLWQRKSWWLLPLVVLAVLLGLLIVLGRMSSVAPFIYS